MILLSTRHMAVAHHMYNCAIVCHHGPSRLVCSQKGPRVLFLIIHSSSRPGRFARSVPSSFVRWWSPGAQEVALNFARQHGGIAANELPDIANFVQQVPTGAANTGTCSGRVMKTPRESLDWAVELVGHSSRG